MQTLFRGDGAGQVHKSNLDRGKVATARGHPQQFRSKLDKRTHPLAATGRMVPKRVRRTEQEHHIVTVHRIMAKVEEDDDHLFAVPGE